MLFAIIIIFFVEKKPQIDCILSEKVSFLFLLIILIIFSQQSELYTKEFKGYNNIIGKID